jgi:hypothetical protein
LTTEGGLVELTGDDGSRLRADPGVSTLYLNDTWCRSCGTILDAGLTWCSICDLPIVISRAAPTPVGAVFRVGRLLFKKPALCVDVTPDGYVLLTSGEKTTVTAIASVADLEVSDLEMPVRQASCAASLLFNAFIATREQAIKVQWDATALWNLAFAYLRGHPDEVLPVAVDAAANGFAELIDLLPLPPMTAAWLSANALFRAGKQRGCAERVLQLPPDGFPNKIPLLAACWQEAQAIDGADRRLIAQLEPFVDRVPIVAPLLASIGLPASLDELHRSIEIGARALVEVGSPRAATLARELSLLNGDEFEQSAFPTTRALGYYRHVTSGAATLPIALASDLGTLPMSMVDDLVDAGAIRVDQIGEITVRDTHPAYLAARIDPARCTEDELRALGHNFELGRRAYLRWDKQKLAEVDDAEIREHFVGLDALREGKVIDLTPAKFLSAFQSKIGMVLDAVQARDLERAETRILADRTLWPAFAACVNPASFEPSGDLLHRVPFFCQWMELARVRSLLFEARWADAVSAATRFLAAATDERLRDEALNLAACGHYQLGDDARAIESLEAALEGEYGTGLLANIGIVAANLAPETAAQHLGKLILEAPTVSMKVAAAQRAIRIWQASESSWVTPTGSDLPQSIAMPLRLLAVLDLPLDRFRELLVLLSEKDAAWLAAASLAQSPHAGTIEARYYKARATGFQQRIQVLAEATRTSLDRDWVLTERNTLAQLALDIVLGESDDSTGKAQFALSLLDEDVVLTPWQRLALTTTTSWTVADALRSSGDEIADRLRDRLLNARPLVNALDLDARERGEALLANALDSVARNVAVYRTVLLGRSKNQFQEIAAVIRRTPSQELNWSAVQSGLRQVRRTAADCEQRVSLMLQFLSNPEHRQLASSLVLDAQDLQRRCGELGG